MTDDLLVTRKHTFDHAANCGYESEAWQLASAAVVAESPDPSRDWHVICLGSPAKTAALGGLNERFLWTVEVFMSGYTLITQLAENRRVTCGMALPQGGGRRRTARSGFTLLELVVVIAIITALAGIVVMILPDVMNKTNKARMVASLTELDKMIQSYQAVHNKYPDNWDSLVGNNTADPYTALPSNATTGTKVGGLLTVQTMNATKLARLTNVNITTVYHMKDPATASGAQNATYMAGGVAATLTANSTPVAFVNVTLAQANSSFKFETGHEYVCFGIGRNCDLIGPGGMVKDAPVIIHNEGCQDPTTVYCAPCAIFDLNTHETYRGVSAKFVGCVALAADGFWTTEEVANNPNQ